ncbi:reverse transcriptase domain-containing protein, partial [Acetobacter pasteurianus]|nr:reverse transcriptase domain-containing protein [Acetobacter pasteurianus]
MVTLKRTGVTDEQIAAILTAYEVKYPGGPEHFTVPMVNRLLAQKVKNFPTQGTTDSQALVARRPVTCYNCGRAGHVSRQCKTKRKLQPTTKAEETLGSSKNSWWAFFGSQSINQKLYFDSGASQHIICDKRLMDHLEPVDDVIKGLGGHSVKVCGKGRATIFLLKDRPINLEDVLYVPEAGVNLISITKATEKGASFLFKDGFVLDAATQTVIGKKDPHMNLLYYVTNQQNKAVSFQALLATAPTPVALWHDKFGHPGATAERKLMDYYNLPSNGETESPIQDCDICAQTKGVVRAPKRGSSSPTQPLALLHADVCGPFSHGAVDKSRYFLTIVDGFSKFVHAVPLQFKSDVPNAIISFIQYSETFFASSGLNYKVGALRTDNGGEFVNNTLHNYMQQKGIHHQLTVPHFSYQNGVAERMHRTLQTKMRAMLTEASMPIQFWPEALQTAAYLTNRTPTASLDGDTPYLKWYRLMPSASHLKPFGCVGFVLIPKTLRASKLAPTNKRCVMLGYDRHHRAYRMFDPEANKIIVSSQVTFHETDFYYQTLKSTPPVPAVNTAPGAVAGGVLSGPLLTHADLDNVLSAPTQDEQDEQDDDTIEYTDCDSSSIQADSEHLDTISADESLAYASDSSHDAMDVLPPAEEAADPSTERPFAICDAHLDGPMSYPDQFPPQEHSLAIDFPADTAVPLALDATGSVVTDLVPFVSIPAPIKFKRSRHSKQLLPVPDASSCPSSAAVDLTEPSSSDSDVALVPTRDLRPAKKTLRLASLDPYSQIVPMGSARDSYVVPMIDSVPNFSGASPRPDQAKPTVIEVDSDTASDEVEAPQRYLEYPLADHTSTCFMAGVQAVDSDPTCPNTCKQAMASPDHLRWKEAFDAEIQALIDNKTFELVSLPPGRQAIPSRWVCQIKPDARLKARVVAKGFKQIKGIDYTATFAPVIRYESMRIMLALAAHARMEIHQMDVTTALLNAPLEEEIYMKQIEGYEDPAFPDKVLKLNKSLYGLKQAPQAWNLQIHDVLLALGFQRNQAEYCLYIRRSSASTVMVALYVDDLLIAGSTRRAIDLVKAHLMSSF